MLESRINHNSEPGGKGQIRRCAVGQMVHLQKIMESANSMEDATKAHNSSGGYWWCTASGWP